ncbi:hypothetical protein AMTR_s00093p00039110 [Amborella trichopoda]|uniref:Uncharacterized protein n=1 Tax=Amborella trichopoda TaxID=13333 RepID=W1NU53_AMBTC|nr:hypothetical protein AMTR_s00093p00039110 [Amborella trichopoda]
MSKGTLSLQNLRHGIKNLKCWSLQILEEFSLQKSLSQPQDVQMTPNKETKRGDFSSPKSMAVIRDEEEYPAQKTIHLEGEYEDFDTWIKDQPSYTLIDGIITSLTKHGRNRANSIQS